MEQHTSWTLSEKIMTGLAFAAIIAAILIFASYITPFLNYIIWGIETP